MVIQSAKSRLGNLEDKLPGNDDHDDDKRHGRRPYR